MFFFRIVDNIPNDNLKALAAVSVNASSTSFETRNMNTELEFICQSYDRKLCNSLFLNAYYLNVKDCAFKVEKRSTSLSRNAYIFYSHNYICIGSIYLEKNIFEASKEYVLQT